MRKILELGGGRTPYFVRYRIPWKTEDEYAAIDVSEENIEFAKKALETHVKNGYTIPLDPVLVVSDATTINLPDNSVDEVVISNTLSAPIHHDWDRDGDSVTINNKNGSINRPILRTSKNEDPFYIERRNLLNEAIRILRPGGQLVIYTDLIIYGIHSYEKLLEELKNDLSFMYQKDSLEETRIDTINKEKVSSGEFCCCFRAEILPRSEVHRFTKF